ncbi:MAG: nucleotidyltransferase domain-containing protein [Planctomycetota bacterium]
MDRAKIEDALRHALARLVPEQPGLAAVYLFGSVARGTPGLDSDVDVGVLLECNPPRTLEGLGIDLADDLSRKLGQRVDLVVLNRAPVDLIKRVLRDGILLVDANPSRRIAFEVRARNEYWDLQPFLERYRRSGTGKP